MKANEVYAKTMKFVWMKLALGMAVVLISILLGAIMFGIAAATGGESFGIMLFLWMIITIGGFGTVNHFLGYVLKAGHVAAVAEIVTTGTVPEDAFKYGIDTVKQKYPTAAAYYAVDTLINGAVNQINKGIDIVGNLLGKIPGMDNVVTFLKAFVNIALGNVDECCMAYTFYKEDQSAFKSAADGVVIYFQNWKVILKSALKLSLVATLLSIVGSFILIIILVAIAAAAGANGMVAFGFGCILAIIISMIIKSAFVDSYTMVSMIHSYMQVAPTTEITFDLYGKLCGLSAKFKSLFEKGQDKQVQA